jgi:hypothetical protein
VDAVVESVATLPGPVRESGFVEALHAASEGVPLAVLETLRLALDRGWMRLGGE